MAPRKPRRCLCFVGFVGSSPVVCYIFVIIISILFISDNTVRRYCSNNHARGGRSSSPAGILSILFLCIIFPVLYWWLFPALRCASSLLPSGCPWLDYENLGWFQYYLAILLSVEAFFCWEPANIGFPEEAYSWVYTEAVWYLRSMGTKCQLPR